MSEFGKVEEEMAGTQFTQYLFWLLWALSLILYTFLRLSNRTFSSATT